MQNKRISLDLDDGVKNPIMKNWEVFFEEDIVYLEEENRMEKFRRQNRSSIIIKIIYIRYDTKGIKELKVRYRKQAQLDTFIIKTKL